MFNFLGKGLVLLHTAGSVLLMAWAVGTYMQFNDFGWKEPYKVWETKDAGRRIPSELDKRTAALYEQYRARERAIPGVRPALDALSEAMERFPKNHLFYVAELEKIRKGEGAIEPKALPFKGGELVLDAGKGLGKPAMTEALAGIDKSLRAYREELKKVQGDVEKITPELEELVKKADEITVQLFGTKDDKGNTVDIGLHEILDTEKVLQDKIAAEKDYVTPIYVDAQRRTENYVDRYRSLQRTLQAFEKKK